MGWTEQPQMSEEERATAELDRLIMAFEKPQEQAVAVGLVMLSLAFKTKPDTSLYIDLTHNVLTFVRRVTELETIKFLADKCFADASDNVPKADIMAILEQMRLRISLLVIQASEDSKRLATLLESGSASDASK
jgi:hypothetical protein